MATFFMVPRFNNLGIKVHFLTLALVLGNMVTLFSQTFPIGEESFTWPDPDRANRNVNVKAYYPAASAGTGTAPASGIFPTVVFGHGFLMSYTAYQNLWEYYVPKGYIFLMVDMETGASPSHEAFGRDLLFTGKTFKSKSETDNSFLLFGAHNGRTAIMGHSMGGGASVLAASYDPSFPDAVICMAAAETNPSAVTAAANVTAPYLVFSGTGDAVTPPADHQIPIYNAVASDCKYWVSITGGAHCYYANTNIACDFGETVSGGNITISRAEQQQTVNTVLEPYLELFLKSNSAQQSAFETALDQSGVNSTVSCTIDLSVDEAVKNQVFVYPNPTSDFIYFKNLNQDVDALEFTNMKGQVFRLSVNASAVDIQSLAAGIYAVKIEGKLLKVIVE